MSKYLFTNRASSTLAFAITPTATSLTVASGQGSLFPSPSSGEIFHVALVDTSGNFELVRCTARSGDVLTVARGVEGTVAQAFSAGSRVELRLTAEIMSSFIQGTVLPTLTANLDLGGNQLINVNWAAMTINAGGLQVSGVPVVLNTRQITIGPGMTGGGALNADVALGLQFATPAEAQNPAIEDRIISPARLGLFTSPAFTWVEPITETAQAYTYIHNLGIYPFVQANLRCRVANNGYAVDDLVDLYSARRADNVSLPVLLISTVDVEVVLPSNFRMMSRSLPGTMIDVDPVNWELHVRGWRFG